MTTNSIADDMLAEFEQPWRGGSPVFACCRRSVQVALGAVDIDELVTMDVTSRVTALRDAVESESPGHLDAHRCCLGHLADLAFDLPDQVGVTA